MLEARLPGVRFESRLQPVREDLPRMDIAAFVGFATTGPLHLPVAVDDSARFREIFGPDPALAWDAQAGQLRYGALGASVENFFANGGRRCWVVRVANAAQAVRHSFALAGLAEGDSDGGASGVATARARAPGSWCEALSIGTRVSRELVTVRQFERNDQDQPDPGPVNLTPGQHRLDLVADPAAFETGELLEVYFDEQLPRLWLFVDRIAPQSGFVSLLGSAQLNGAHTLGAYWVEPVVASPGDDEIARLLTVTQANATATLGAAGILDALDNWPVTRLNEVMSVRRMRLELAIWRNTGLVARLGDLGFARSHPRYWATLPTDRALLGSPTLSRPERELAALDDEVRSPRFPLAGPQDNIETLPEYYLPLEAGDRLDRESATSVSVLDGTALQRDGLANFDETLFVDRALASVHSSLLAEAEHIYYVRQRDLTGLHSLLPVGEVSLIAVPDAHHGGWARQLPPAADSLGAPVLSAIPGPDSNGAYPIEWTAVSGATGYLLERDFDPDFPTATVVYDGAETGATLYIDPGCPRRFYLRVRAWRYSEPGPWSNTRQRILPPPLFVTCEGAPPAELTLSLDIESSPPALTLSWQTPGGEPDAAEQFELQEASNADFVGAEATLTDMPAIALPEADSGTESESRRYFRVRGLNGEQRGPWSNTVIVEADARVNWTLLPESEYDDGVLLQVHRALLRFAAARADMLALLSLPRHYRTTEAALHVGKLTAGGNERLGGNPDTGRVPPLTLGENPILSYGALMHPWLTVRVPDRGVARETVTVAVPPDGVVAGSMAALSIARGAWLAPANRVLQRVLALDPPLDLEDWRQLTPARVNLVLQSPQGFLLFSEKTLSVDETFAPIHIRRLMILLRRLALREGDRYVFANNDNNLQHLVRHRFELVLGDLYTRGAFMGVDPSEAFRVVTDASVNPPPSVERGRFIVELQVAPARALAFITVRLVADERGRLTVEGP